MYGWWTNAQHPVWAVGLDRVPDSAGMDGFDGGLIVRFKHDAVG